MALQKEKITASGAPAIYWRIHNMSVDWVSSSLVIGVTGYYSEEAREQGLAELAKFYFTTTPNELVFSSGDPRTELYTYLKTLPEFEGSIDT